MNVYRPVCIVSALAAAWLGGCNSQPEPGAAARHAAPLAPRLDDASTQPTLLVAASIDQRVAGDPAQTRSGALGEGIRPSSGASGIQP